jgi:acylphosphatase
MVVVEAKVTDEAHSPAPEPSGGPGDPDEEARLEAALLAEIQRSVAGLGEDGPGAAGPGMAGPGAAGPGAAGPGAAGPGAAGPGAAGPGAAGSQTVRLTAWLRGRVQGVGLRWWARSRALELGLSGWAENLADGRVKVVAEGPREACAQLLELLDGGDTPGQVAHVTHRWDAARGGLAGFAER